MINKTYSIIIKYLTSKKEYVTARELSQLIGVSIRTIKRYIKDINYFVNDYGIEITSAKGVGYKIEGPLKEIKRISQEAENLIEGFKIDDSSEGRIAKVLCILLRREYVTIEELSLELNLSVASTNILSAGVKKILKNYDLELISKPFHGSKIVGEEIKIRSLMFDYAIKADENYSLEIRINNITRNEIEQIQSIINKVLRTSNIIICDKDVNVLLIRIIISVSRMKNKYVFANDELKYIYKLNNYGLVREIMQQVSETFNFNIDENEVLYVSSSCGVAIYDYNTRKELIKSPDVEIDKFVDQALQDVFIITGIDFREDVEFTDALVMHLKIFINRFKAGISAKNPLLDQIKVEFPMETNLATIIVTKLQREFKVTLDENEIGFIALHFGAAFERRRGKNGKKICIICHYGIGTSQLLAEKLKQRISNINIVGTYPVSYLDVALKQDVDFIVSTVKLNDKDFKVPVLYIENIFSDEIVNELHDIFSEEKQRSKILRETFNKEAFFRIKANTREEAIKNIGQAMKSKGFINDEVITKVLEREKMSSTDIGNMVAIPHTIVEGTYNSIIGVGILEKPLIWNKEEVQLVFMVCFNKKESYKFHVFEYLYSFIKDKGAVKRVVKDFSFEKLMRLLDV